MLYLFKSKFLGYIYFNIHVGKNLDINITLQIIDRANHLRLSISYVLFLVLDHQYLNTYF